MSEQLTNDTDLRVDVTVDASIERTFATFTERTHEWWPSMYRLGGAERTHLQIEAVEGGRWFEVGTDGSTCDWGRVLAWEPPRRVALGWQITPSFGPESDPDRASRIDVRLVPEGVERTRVTLVHSGFERHGEGWELVRQGVDGNGGWPGILVTFASVAAAV